ncbi:sigma-54-dependent Fis family transcriptional regulator [bacterium]|nr:sigma-54-dependent Fis family transcriptional regulator [bacterium]
METKLNKNTLVYVVDDEEIIREFFKDWLHLTLNCQVQTFENGKKFLEFFTKEMIYPDVILLDLMMPEVNGIAVLGKMKEIAPEIPVIVISAQNLIETAVQAMHLGAYDYVSKPIDDFDKFEILIRNAIKNSNLSKEVKRLKDLVSEKFNFSNILSQSPKMEKVFSLMEKTLSNDVTVALYGESGTGKELIAKAIHYNSNRKNEPFVVINCTAIPKDLLESELFGHEKGSFTGAIAQKIGKFEHANNGTIFLDEIGDMSIELQAKLLRVLQTREFQRVGGNDTIKTNLRIISATNKDLRDEVKKGIFREDLFYRLTTFPINLPPLRERKEDIPLLAEYFVNKFCKKFDFPIKKISKNALKNLVNYDWNGNIRELENMIERCVLISNEIITEEDLPIEDYHQKIKTQNISSLFENLQSLSEVPDFEFIKEKALEVAYKLSDKNISEAAKALGLGRATFYRLMKKYNIEN